MSSIQGDYSDEKPSPLVMQTDVDLPEGVQVQTINADAIFSEKDNQVCIFLVVWIAFYNSLVGSQDAAEVKRQEAYYTNQVQNRLIDYLSSIDYEVLGAGEAKKADQKFIMEFQNKNQVIQAEINIAQDRVGQVQQQGQLLSSEAANIVQSSTQTINTSFSISQLWVELVKGIAR